MAAQTSIVLADGQATPVNRTFSARGATAQVARYMDVSGGIAIGMPTITLGNQQTAGSNGTFRLEARITVPVLEVISGSDGGYTPAPKPAYNMFAKIELVAPNRSTLQNRKDLHAYVKNLLAHAVPQAMFTDFDIPT